MKSVAQLIQHSVDHSIRSLFDKEVVWYLVEERLAVSLAVYLGVSLGTSWMDCLGVTREGSCGR